MSIYERAKSYAYKLEQRGGLLSYKDLLHDSYIAWYNKTQKNLLEEPIGVVLKVIKYTFRAKMSKERFQYDKDRNNWRKFVEFEDHICNNITPEKALIGKDEVKHLISNIELKYPRSSEQMLEALRLKFEGYSQDEIADHLNLTKSHISYYFSNIRKL